MQPGVSAAYRSASWLSLMCSAGIFVSKTNTTTKSSRIRFHPRKPNRVVAACENVSLLRQQNVYHSFQKQGAWISSCLHFILSTTM